MKGRGGWVKLKAVTDGMFCRESVTSQVQAKFPKCKRRQAHMRKGPKGLKGYYYGGNIKL